MENLIDKIAIEAVKNFNEKLKSYLIENLNKLGYTFKDDVEFYAFAQARIARVETNEIYPNEYRFYLNFGEESEVCIGSYYDTIITEVKIEEASVRYTAIFSSE